MSSRGPNERVPTSPWLIESGWLLRFVVGFAAAASVGCATRMPISPAASWEVEAVKSQIGSV